MESGIGTQKKGCIRGGIASKDVRIGGKNKGINGKNIRKGITHKV